MSPARSRRLDSQEHPGHERGPVQRVVLQGQHLASWPPKMTSWWAISPGRRTEDSDPVDLAAPGTGYRLGAACQLGIVPAVPRPPRLAAIALAVRSAVPEGASALPWWWSSMTSAAG